MKLYNTFTQKNEEFKPVKDEVSLYTCGPTVYDSAHIGNLRAYIFGDLLKRTLIANGYKVNHVMNITDVDDKTIRKGEGNWQKFKEVTDKFEKKFWEDLEKLNNLKPNSTPHATAYIDQIISFVKELENKGFAYKAGDGSVYFSIEKFKDYGKLANLDQENLKAGARVEQDEYDKENPSDFALWKAWDEADGEIAWDSPWGKGRPGWHIECSVMSTAELGDTIDIHTGGIDLVFPHHENEIAQTEAKTGKKFVNYWLHNEHLLVDGKKMSKSLHNFYVLDDIIDKGYSALDFRYLVLQSHYRSKMNFTWTGMESAKNTRNRLIRLVDDCRAPKEGGEIIDEYKDQFLLSLSEDLNSPLALSVFWEMMRDEKANNQDKVKTAQFFDEIIGLGIFGTKCETIPDEINQIAEERKQARVEKDYLKSDQLRCQINDKGYEIEDLANNEFKIFKKS